MCTLMLAEETNFLLMEGKQHSGTARATSGCAQFTNAISVQVLSLSPLLGSYLDGN